MKICDLFRPGRHPAGQAVRFAIVGVVNTLTDIGLLNMLTWLFGAYRGKGVFGLNFISYGLATINSYFLNKYWTFDDREARHEAAKFTQFIVIGLLGAISNSSIVSALTTAFAPPALLIYICDSCGSWLGLPAIAPKVLWLNAAKIVATLVVMIANFFLYRYWIFRKHANPKQ